MSAAEQLASLVAEYGQAVKVAGYLFMFACGYITVAVTK